MFRLIGEGHGTRQIADELHLSVKTIESYQAHIKEKLALRNARELLQHAIEWTVNLKGGVLNGFLPRLHNGDSPIPHGTSPMKFRVCPIENSSL